MSTAVLVLVVCAAIDLFALAILFGVVWLQHQGMRKEAETRGEVVPSAARQFGCLLATGLGGFAPLYGIAWFLLR